MASPREPPISPQTCGGPGACQAAAVTPPTSVPPGALALISLGPGEMSNADRGGVWGTVGGVCPLGSGLHCPPPHFPLQTLHPPTASMEAVPTLPHGEVSAPKRPGHVAGAPRGRRPHLGAVIFVFPADLRIPDSAGGAGAGTQQTAQTGRQRYPRGDPNPIQRPPPRPSVQDV